MIMVGAGWFASKTDEDWAMVMNAFETLRGRLQAKEGPCTINHKGRDDGSTRGPKNGRYGETGKWAQVGQ